MPSPNDPSEIKATQDDLYNGPVYHFAEDDEEDPDTVETRKSIKYAEK
jgi:hypothetical protein